MLGAGLLMLAVIPANPVTPIPWFTFEDYPMKAFEKKWEGITTFEILVTPQGTVANCRVTESSGHEELDRQTCFLATKRAKFAPATVDGRLVFGVYRSEAAWALPERSVGTKAGPDLEVTLNKLPEGTLEPPVVKVAYAVDASGQPSSCVAMPSARKQPPVLVELGCRQLLESIGNSPVVSSTGQPVAAVRTGAIKFRPEI